MYKFVDILNELSSRRNELSLRIAQMENEILEHSIKLIISEPENNNRNHWIAELWGFVHSFSNKTLKGTNKRPNAKFYWSQLWEPSMEPDPFQSMEFYLGQVFDYSHPQNFYIRSRTVSQLKIFYKAFCELLSEKSITKQEFYDFCNHYLSSAKLNIEKNTSISK